LNDFDVERNFELQKLIIVFETVSVIAGFLCLMLILIFFSC